MSDSNVYRNLLVGILSHQMGLIDRTRLIAAMRQWITNKSQPLEQILEAHGGLPKDVNDFVVALVERHIQALPVDDSNSLTVLSSLGSLCDELRSLGDPAVERTLHDAVSEVPSALRPTCSFPVVETIGTGMARFRVLRPHARGGLGTVSIAYDQELHREVALKQIQHRHADSTEQRGRFLLEAEITGCLEHPGVVPVYSLGQDADGRPFYAMRFIRGDSLAEAIKDFHQKDRFVGRAGERVLELRKLLGRLVDVCNAIAYAHSRGVLHRDLKPGNIMLGKYGETLVVDWGLAKATGRSDPQTISDERIVQPSSGDSSTPTVMGSALGTPQYMSPEQAEGRLDLLGPQTDVYGLGATLYCLLTGVTPFQGEHKEEILRKVQRGDFPRPRAIDATVPRPLEAICSKTMALKPQDRYATPLAMAEDIERWLADEPVSVYREPWSDRFTRTVRRHKTAFVGTATVLLSLVTALAVIAGLTQRQNRELRAARDAADESRRLAERESGRATENLATSRELAMDVLNVAERELSQVPGKESLRKQMTERSLAVFQKFYEQQPDEPAVQWELAQVSRMSANLDRLTNNTERALASYVSAVSMLDRLVSATTKPETQDYLAETLVDRAVLLQKTGRLRESADDLSRAVEVANRLRESAPGEARYRRTEAKVRLQLADIDVEFELIEDAVSKIARGIEVFRELADGHDAIPFDVPYLLLVMTQQGELLRTLGRLHTSEAILMEALQRARTRVATNKERASRHILARVLLECGRTLKAGDDALEAAGKHIEDAIAIWTSLVTEYPQTLDYQNYLAYARVARAELSLATKDPELARTDLEAARVSLQAIADKASKLLYHESLAQCLAALARLEMNSGNREPAIQLQQQAIRTQEKVVAQNPESKRAAAVLERLAKEFQMVDR